ncbi:MAG: SAM-dependent methyltransferase [Micromonosporaceae bacterium]|nr:SAM-dependent methyltransferase [Micromonosporaceae bacterium]
MPAQPLDTALAEVRALLLDPARLTRAVAAGRRRGQAPSVVRAELRPVRLKAGMRLQVVTSDGVRPYTRNLAFGAEADAAVDALLAEPFGNWHVQTTDATVQVRVTKSGAAQVHRAATRSTADTAHDREKEYLLDPGDPLFDVIGGSAAKRRQVDAFLRALAATLPANEALPRPLRVVDLGCGNAYLTFAAYRYLTASRGLDVRLIGVDVREDQRARNTELAERLGWADKVHFVAGTISDAPVDGADVVLALHACDTATDEALARAIEWRAPWVLAAPCCHHDIAAQLRRVAAPAPYALLTSHGILRERFADVLTDALRAALLRRHGYRVDVVEFVDSAHTPRNVLIRGKYTGASADGDEYAALVEMWQVTPRLAALLGEDRSAG